MSKADKVEYPSWVCLDCGKQYGRRRGGICTMHNGRCDVCGENKAVTEPRDFGHLLDGWQYHCTAAGVFNMLKIGERGKLIHASPAIDESCDHDWRHGEDHDGQQGDPEQCTKCGISFTRYIFCCCP